MKNKATIQEGCRSWLHEIKNVTKRCRKRAIATNIKTNPKQPFFSLTQGATQPNANNQHIENEMKKHGFMSRRGEKKKKKKKRKILCGFKRRDFEVSAILDGELKKVNH